MIKKLNIRQKIDALKCENNYEFYIKGNAKNRSIKSLKKKAHT